MGFRSDYAAMEQPRILILNDRIKDQIELVAELICAGENAVGAVQMLDRLTRELVAEEHRASGPRRQGPPRFLPLSDR